MIYNPHTIQHKPPHNLISLTLFTLIFSLFSTTPSQAETNSLVEFSQRYAKLKPDDNDARFALAIWCVNKKMPIRAMDLYRQILNRDPNHQKAYANILHLAATTRLPLLKQRHQKLLAEFPGYQLHTTRHFVILYNTDKAWALNRAVLLEKTHHLYFNAFQHFGLKPLPVTGRMVCILFEEHTDFTKYAKRVDGYNMGWSGGYYSSRTNRIAFFNDKNNPQFNDVKEKMAALETKITELRKAIKIASQKRNNALVSQFRQELQTSIKNLNFYRNRINDLANMSNISKTTHEAAHQLAYNTTVQSRGTLYPFWISEGFATNFEAIDAAKDFGPQHDNLSRRKLLNDVVAKKQLTPLRKFITMVHINPKLNTETIANHYAQAWGFYRFTLNYYRPQLENYYKLIAKNQSRNPDPDLILKTFQQAFGDIDTLERKWLNYSKNLRH